MSDNEVFFNALSTALGPNGFAHGDEVEARYCTDWSGATGPRPKIVARPASTEEVSTVMRLCSEAQQPVIVQGGRTGVVAGAVPREGELVLSLERLNAIEALDAPTATLTVQAGAILQEVQEHVEAHGFMFPLDLGSRGSCTIGGNIATNAGGNRVIRFGMMRELVVGVEAVLADGTIIPAARRMLKDNAGYDLKQLFIGSEGTLGVVTRAVLRLYPLCPNTNVAFCATETYEQALALLVMMRAKLGGALSAFELMWPNFYREVLEATGLRAPLQPGLGYYALIEAQASSATDAALLEQALASAAETGIIVDAVVSQSAAAARAFWSVRDGVASAYQALAPCHSYDIGLENFRIGDFAAQAETEIKTRWPRARMLTFGHIGDGNLHLLVSLGADDTQASKFEIDTLIYDLVQHYQGSISAEHGIGQLKAPYLHHSRSEAEINLMHTMKRALDPTAILAPGRLTTLQH